MTPQLNGFVNDYLINIPQYSTTTPHRLAADDHALPHASTSHLFVLVLYLIA